MQYKRSGRTVVIHLALVSHAFRVRERAGGQQPLDDVAYAIIALFQDDREALRILLVRIRRVRVVATISRVLVCCVCRSGTGSGAWKLCAWWNVLADGLLLEPAVRCVQSVPNHTPVILGKETFYLGRCQGFGR